MNQSLIDIPATSTIQFTVLFNLQNCLSHHHHITSTNQPLLYHQTYPYYLLKNGVMVFCWYSLLRLQNKEMLSLVRTKSAARKKRTIIVGLNAESSGREILLRMLVVIVKTGDNVVAVRVSEPNDNFDPNTFHIHEDLCKSKQV